MTSRRVDFVIQSRSNQKATSWKGFTLDKCTCMVKELPSEFKINNTTNICAFKLNVKVISTEQCSLFIRFMHVCMCMCVCVCACVCLCVRLTDLLQVILSDGSTECVKP